MFVAIIGNVEIPLVCLLDEMKAVGWSFDGSTAPQHKFQLSEAISNRR